jgi:hypothetical protein
MKAASFTHMDLMLPETTLATQSSFELPSSDDMH